MAEKAIPVSICWLCDICDACDSPHKGKTGGCPDDIYEMQHVKAAKRRTKNTALNEKGGGSK